MARNVCIHFWLCNPSMTLIEFLKHGQLRNMPFSEPDKFIYWSYCRVVVRNYNREPFRTNTEATGEGRQCAVRKTAFFSCFTPTLTWQHIGMGLWAHGKSFLRLYYSLIICSRLLARTYGIGCATRAGRQVGKQLPRWLVWMVRCRTILLCSPASILKDHSGDVRFQSRRARKRCKESFTQLCLWVRL